MGHCAIKAECPTKARYKPVGSSMKPKSYSLRALNFTPLVLNLTNILNWRSHRYHADERVFGCKL